MTEQNFLSEILPYWSYDSYDIVQTGSDPWQTWCTVARVIDGLAVDITARLDLDKVDYLFSAPCLRVDSTWTKRDVTADRRAVLVAGCQLFGSELGWAPEVDGSGYIITYTAYPLDIFVGSRAERIVAQLRWIGASW